MCVWLPFQPKEALFAALRLTFCVNYKRLLHMAIFRSASESTRIIDLLGLLIEALSLYEIVA